MKRKQLFILIASIVSPQAYAENPISLAPVVVTATRTEQSSFDLPVAIDVVGKKDIQNGQLQMTLSESLIRVPGITAQNRNNQAQDPQISSRGFGSRSSFGVRGVRVYVDGIPLTMPDGQGQPGIVDLSAIKSIEVMRGPFSAMYGNSSGGVIQMLTEDAPKTPEVGATVMFGSDDTKREILNAAGTSENIGYLLNVSNYETDGSREHDAGKKQQVTAKFKIHLDEDTNVTALVNWFDQKAQDPLGLGRTISGEPSAFINPEKAVASATQSNTRVERSHTQIGINLEHALNANNSVNLMAYVGTRENLQYLALPSTTPVFANGRASEISREFYGIDTRWDNNGDVFGKAYTLSAGLTYGKSTDARRDTNADNGVMRATNVTNNGNRGLNRNEDNISTNFDQYLQGKLALVGNVDIHAGVRHTRVNLEVIDKFTTGLSANGNNSGEVTYSKTTPVIGAVWKVNPAFNLYANYGKGFETPTFIEAAYNIPASGAQPNLTLKPSESSNYELGAKAFLGDNTQANLTIFRTTTENEIVLSAGGAIPVYTNANKTKREGAELSIITEFSNHISLYGAYTLLNAKFDSPFNAISTGNRIPGTYHNQFYAEATWKHEASGFSTALEGLHNSQVFVNDINTDKAPAYTILNLRAGFEQKLARWNFSEYVRVENITDKDYISSVRINDTTARFFEPGAGRTYLLGLNANYKF
jgi:iron complex outermembrane receptor protein